MLRHSGSSLQVLVRTRPRFEVLRAFSNESTTRNTGNHSEKRISLVLTGINSLTYTVGVILRCRAVIAHGISVVKGI